MRLDRGDAQQQKKEKKRKEKSHSSEFHTTIPGQNLTDAQEEPRHPCCCVLWSREVPVIQRGRVFVSPSDLHVWWLFVWLFLKLPFFAYF